MSQVAPAGGVYQAGTLSGNPLSVSAGLATLRALREREGAYARLEQLGADAERVLLEAIGSAGVAGCVNRVGSMLTLFFGVERVRGHADASRADTAAFGRFFNGMIDEGVYLPPSQFEAMFVSLSHGEVDIDRLAVAARNAIRTV
jgi:glutamate-1-semialdehyde 2,1-aminomutase